MACWSRVSSVESVHAQRGFYAIVIHGSDIDLELATEASTQSVRTEYKKELMIN